jgi:hypothetical protein
VDSSIVADSNLGKELLEREYRAKVKKYNTQDVINHVPKLLGAEKCNVKVDATIWNWRGQIHQASANLLRTTFGLNAEQIKQLEVLVLEGGAKSADFFRMSTSRFDRRRFEESAAVR